MRTLLVDNHDSFTYNLWQYLAEVNGEEPDVVLNDDPAFRLSDLDRYDNVLLSPGPGTPRRRSDLGHCLDVIASGRLPVLGVCLGHQAVAQFYGATVGRAPQARHGRSSPVLHSGTGLFHGLPSPFPAVRYHSLAVTDLPAELEPLAWTPDGVLMALRHRERPLWGVQFHPESVGTDHGHRLLHNFATLTRAWWNTPRTRPRDHARSHGTRQPFVAEAEADADADAQPAPDGRRRLRILVGQVPTRCSAEVAFDQLFRPSPYAFWLDSSRPEAAARMTGNGRFSIMGDARGRLARIATADVSEGTVQIQADDGVILIRADFLDWLAADLAGIELDAPEFPFGFALGWVGCLGYELKAQCGGSAAHRSPDPDAVLVFPQRAVVLDHLTAIGYVLILTDDAEPGNPAGGRELAELTAALRALDGAQAAPIPDTDHSSDSSDSSDVPRVALRHDRDSYLKLVQACQERILDGESYEICLTNLLEGPGRVDAWSAYRQLRRANPVPFGALLQFGELTVLSTSPERFLRVDAAGRVESKPIKGTRPRGGTPAEDEALRRDLAGSEKDRAENLMIVDLVRNDLGRHAEVGSVEVPVLFDVESYASVHQLVSTVRARLRPGHSAVDLVRSAFPGGSMTGAPKLRAMQIIDELEAGPRGVYSGAIGYFSLRGEADLSIVIRTVVVTPDRVSYGVGGAVITLSDPAAEFEETMVKATPFLHLIGARPDDLEVRG